MNSSTHRYDDEDHEDSLPDSREDRPFKKLKRPAHNLKRSKTPERLRGMHRRRRKRMGW
ncbi:MAG: hypothetical protein GY768_07745 [Planctomycetaceae bacterium]|nr:hypothetical protein [Planctomycetaceae bacterium]